jgi:hypothetical protein
MEMNMGHWWNDNDKRKAEILRRKKNAPLPFCPSKIMHGRVPDRTRANTVRGRRLAASSEALNSSTQHKLIFCFKNKIFRNRSCFQSSKSSRPRELLFDHEEGTRILRNVIKYWPDTMSHKTILESSP